MASVEPRGVKRKRDEQPTPERAPEIKRARLGPLAALDKLTENISTKTINDITTVVSDLLREIAMGGLKSGTPSELDEIRREITLVSSHLKTRSTFPKPLFSQLQVLRSEFHLRPMIDTSKEGIEDLTKRGLVTFNNNILFFHDDIAKDVTDVDLTAILQHEPLKDEINRVSHFDFARYNSLSAASIGIIAKHCPNLEPACFRMLHEQPDVYCDQKFRLKGSDDVFSVNKGFLQILCPDLFQFFELGSFPKPKSQDENPEDAMSLIAPEEIPELVMTNITPDDLRFVLGLLTGVQEIRIRPYFLHSTVRLVYAAGLLGAVTVVKQCDSILAKNYFAPKLQDTTLSLEDKMAFLKEIREALEGRYESLPLACQAAAREVPTFLGPVLRARLAKANPDEAVPTIDKTFKEVLPFGLSPLVDFSCMVSLIEMFPSKEVRTAIFKNIFENVPNLKEFWQFPMEEVKRFRREQEVKAQGEEAVTVRPDPKSQREWLDALLAKRLSEPLKDKDVPLAKKMKFLEHFSETYAESFETLPEARTVVYEALLLRLFTPLCKAAYEEEKTDYTPEEAARALSCVRHVLETLEPFGLRELFVEGQIRVTNYISLCTGDVLFKTALNLVVANEPAVSLEFGKLMGIIQKNRPSGSRTYTSLHRLQDQAAAAGFDIKGEAYSRDDVLRGLAFLTRAVGLFGPYGIQLQDADGDFMHLVSGTFVQATMQYLFRDEDITAACTRFIETLYQHDPSVWQLPTLLSFYRKSNALKAKELIEAELAKGSDNPFVILSLNLFMADLLITGGEGIEIDPGRAADFAQRAILHLPPDSFVLPAVKPPIALVVQRAGRTEDALALLDVNDPLQQMWSLFIRKLRGEAFQINDLPFRQGMIQVAPYDMILIPLMKNVLLGEFPKEVRDEDIQMINLMLGQGLFILKLQPLLALQFKEVLGQYPEDAKAVYLDACPDLKLLLT